MPYKQHPRAVEMRGCVVACGPSQGMVTSRVHRTDENLVAVVWWAARPKPHWINFENPEWVDWRSLTVFADFRK